VPASRGRSAAPAGRSPDASAFVEEKMLFMTWIVRAPSAAAYGARKWLSKMVRCETKQASGT
jgi:hypothetical protein